MSSYFPPTLYDSGYIPTSSLISANSSPTISSTTKHHNVATFVGAVGGSVGFLGALAFGLCISIRYRRVRASRREARERRMAYAEPFTAVDHGELPDDDIEQRASHNGATMRQAGPAPFVPRYFPGSTPASPPPYVAEGTGNVIATSTTNRDSTFSPTTVSESGQSSNMMSVTRAGVPIAVPSSTPPSIAIPTPILDLSLARSTTSMSIGTSESYADRPPPTPPDEETRVSLFGPLFSSDTRRDIRGGIVGPVASYSPLAEESDPMLSVGFDDEDGEGYRDQPQNPNFERTGTDRRGEDAEGMTSEVHRGRTSDSTNMNPSVTSAIDLHTFGDDSSALRPIDSSIDSDEYSQSSLPTRETTTSSTPTTPPSFNDPNNKYMNTRIRSGSLVLGISAIPSLSSSTSLPVMKDNDFTSSMTTASSTSSLSPPNQPRLRTSLPNLSNATNAVPLTLTQSSLSKPDGGLTVAYPPLQPSRIPLPPSLYSGYSRKGSQENIGLHNDSGS